MSTLKRSYLLSSFARNFSYGVFLIRFIASHRSKGLLSETIASSGNLSLYSPATRIIKLAPIDIPTPTIYVDFPANFSHTWLRIDSISVELAISGKTGEVKG